MSDRHTKLIMEFPDASRESRAEISRLRKKLSDCRRTLREIADEDLPIVGDGSPQEVLIATQSALLDLIDYMEDEGG